MRTKHTILALLLGTILATPTTAVARGGRDEIIPGKLVALGYRMVLHTTIKRILSKQSEYRGFLEQAFSRWNDTEIHDVDTKAGAAKAKALRGRPVLTLTLHAKQVVVSGTSVLACRIQAQFREQVRVKRTGKEVMAITGSREDLYVGPLSDKGLDKMRKACVALCMDAARDARR